MTELCTRIVANLERFERKAVDDAELRHAAVAIVVMERGDDDRPAFLLTRRGGALRRHSGQWALPGGRLDQGESVEQAALRELDEELGLALAPDRVLGVLDDYPTRSGFCITPIVMWGGENADLTPDPSEVAAVHRVPLADLEQPNVPHLEPIAESDRPVLSIPFESLGHRVYAPTAAMIFQFREVALHGRSTRVRDFEQPLFAWK